MTQTYGTRQDEFGHLFPEWQAEVIEINHAEALMMNEARGMAVVMVTGSGLRITREMLDSEMRCAREARTGERPAAMPLVIGLNASISMYG
jgi:hypothetical protein